MAKIKYGTEDYGPDEFDPRLAKARITTYIDLDILDELRLLAKKRGEKYQTLLNRLLRNMVFPEKEEKGTIANLEARLTVLEKTMKKNKK